MKKLLKNVNVDLERRLISIKESIARSDSRHELNYSALFNLVRVLDQTPSFVFLNSNVIELFNHTLSMFLNSWSFEDYRGEDFKQFIYDFYSVNQDDPLTVVLQNWRQSRFYVHREPEPLKESVFSTVFFNILKQSVEKNIIKNQDYVQSIIEVGQTDFKQVCLFLADRNIPFSGPYQVKFLGELKLQIFISSFDEAENFANRGRPLFGVFEFPLDSLRIFPEEAQQFAESLAECPAWIQTSPPAFFKPLQTLRNYII